MNIGESLRTAGFKITTKLVHDDFDGLVGQSVWEVGISRDGHTHTMHFHQAVIKRYFPNGSLLDFHHVRKPVRVAQLEANKTTKPIKPNYANCMYKLFSDAQSVYDYKSFAEFCADYGYSENSRARAAYSDCIDQREGLDRLGADYDGLTELFEDY